MKRKSNEIWENNWHVFAGCIFLGLGIGIVAGAAFAGLLIGAGVGFLAMAAIQTLIR